MTTTKTSIPAGTPCRIKYVPNLVFSHDSYKHMFRKGVVKQASDNGEAICVHMADPETGTTSIYTDQLWFNKEHVQPLAHKENK